MRVIIFASLDPISSPNSPETVLKTRQSFNILTKSQKNGGQDKKFLYLPDKRHKLDANEYYVYPN